MKSLIWLSIRMRRGGLVGTAVALLTIIVLSALVAAYFSARTPMTAAMDVGFSLLRLALPLMIFFSANELISREFDVRYYLNSMTYPISRSRWLFQRVVAISGFGLVVLITYAVFLATLVWLVPTLVQYEQLAPPSLGSEFWIVVGFITIDILVTVSLACCLAVFARTPSFVIVVGMGVVLIARSYAAIAQLLSEQGYLVEAAVNPVVYEKSIRALSFIVPNLGALDLRTVALYKQLVFLPKDIWLDVVSALSYALILQILAIWWIERKDIS